MSDLIRPDEYPAFAGLCLSYFHQDWDLEDPDPLTAVDRYVEDVSKDGIQPLIEEIDLLRPLMRQRAEAEALDLLFSFGCEYYPPGAGQTVDAWLASLRDRAASLAQG